MNSNNPVTAGPSMTGPGSPDSIVERGRAVVLAGEERFVEPLTPGLARWGLALVVRADAAATEVLDQLTGRAAALAGPGQWRTGSRGAAHITVCYLERAFREIPAGDPALSRFARLARRTAEQTGPLAWDLTGPVLADNGVLVSARPVGGAPDDFRAALLSELGEHGEDEAAYRGRAWWSSLLHFAAPVADRVGLVGWADGLAGRQQGRLTARTVDVVRYEHRPVAVDPAGPRTVPVTLTTCPLAGSLPRG